jgi:diadenosine tetraphosphate (Ap4A) HIT family hydrolase
MTFKLHPNLESKPVIVDLALSRVLLHDEANYPWILLVPRRPGVSRIMDLSKEDQLQLLAEIDLAQKILWEEFSPTQLNVAAIGNKTDQLHLHVIARFAADPAWPHTVWDHPEKKPYSFAEKEQIVARLFKRFNTL